MVIVINSLISGLGWVDVEWLATSTVRLQESDYSQLYGVTYRSKFSQSIFPNCMQLSDYTVRLHRPITLSDYTVRLHRPITALQND